MKTEEDLITSICEIMNVSEEDIYKPNGKRRITKIGFIFSGVDFDENISYKLKKISFSFKMPAIKYKINESAGAT